MCACVYVCVSVRPTLITISTQEYIYSLEYTRTRTFIHTQICIWFLHTSRTYSEFYIQNIFWCVLSEQLTSPRAMGNMWHKSKKYTVHTSSNTPYVQKHVMYFAYQKYQKIQFTYKKNTCDLHNTLYQLQNTSKNTLHPQNTSKSKLYQQTLSKIQFTYPKYTVQTPGCDTQN